MPAARQVGAQAGGSAALTVVLLFFLILLFPDGRLPLRRWRPVAWALFVVAAAWVTQSLQAGTKISGGLTNALVAANATYPNPFGFLPRHGWYSGLLKLSFVLGIVTGVLVIASVFVRRRGASYELRRQVAWLGYVGALTILCGRRAGRRGRGRPGPRQQLARHRDLELLGAHPRSGHPGRVCRSDHEVPAL